MHVSLYIHKSSGMYHPTVLSYSLLTDNLGVKNWSRNFLTNWYYGSQPSPDPLLKPDPDFLHLLRTESYSQPFP